MNLKNLLDFHNKNKKTVTVTAVPQPPRFGNLIIKNKTVIDFAEKESNQPTD